jgi:hypothetical protein
MLSIVTTARMPLAQGSLETDIGVIFYCRFRQVKRILIPKIFILVLHQLRRSVAFYLNVGEGPLADFSAFFIVHTLRSVARNDSSHHWSLIHPSHVSNAFTMYGQGDRGNDVK